MTTFFYMVNALGFFLETAVIGWQLVVNGRQPTTADLFWMILLGVNFIIANGNWNAAHDPHRR